MAKIIGVESYEKSDGSVKYNYYFSAKVPNENVVGEIAGSVFSSKEFLIDGKPLKVGDDVKVRRNFDKVKNSLYYTFDYNSSF